MLDPSSDLKLVKLQLGFGLYAEAKGKGRLLGITVKQKSLVSLSSATLMAWDLIFWLIFFLMNIALIASSLYQIITLSDLESDYLNPYEVASRINYVVLPEFILHGVLCSLFLFTWHWFMFLITLPLAYYNLMLYIKRKHLIDVTEVFRSLNVEKEIRIVKLVFYLVLFVLITVRFFAGGALLIYHSESQELDIRSSFLEF